MNNIHKKLNHDTSEDIDFDLLIAVCNQIKEDVAMLKALEDAQTQKETDKVNGKKKLKDLGLTDAEVDALIGG